MRRYLRKEPNNIPPGLAVAQQNLIRNRISQQWGNFTEPEKLINYIIHYMMNDVSAPLRRTCTVPELQEYMLEEYANRWPEDLEEPEGMGFLSVREEPK